MAKAAAAARPAVTTIPVESMAPESPTLPTSGEWSQDAATLRLRDLTEYVYQMITIPQSR